MAARETSDYPPSSGPDGRASPPRPQRRKSILVDPDESPQDRHRRRRSRSQSQVRLQEPPQAEDDSDGSLVDGWYVRRRDGRIDFVPDNPAGKRSSTRNPDLEHKTAPKHRDFRAKRDGYESEEGETHRRVQSSDRPPRRDREGYGGKDRDGYDAPRGDRREYDAPRGDRRDYDAPRGDRRDYDAPRDRRDYDAPRSTRPPPNESPPREPGITALGAGVGAAAGAAVAAGAAKKLRPRNRSPRARPPQDYYDRGYGSDGPPPDRRPRGYSRERPRRARDGSPSRYQRRGSSVPPPPPYSRGDRYADDRRRPRRRNDSYPPPRDREYDDRRRPRDGKEQKDWKKEAGSFLVATALPFIRKHGEKYLKEQVERRIK